MPSGKYYCDYCDKEFQDTQVARKRHLQSNPHLRAKALWYSSASDRNQQVSNFAPRGLCNRFVTSNFCPFGDSCRYLHPNNNIPGSTGFANNNTQPHDGFPNQHIQASDFVSGGPGTGWFDLPPSLKPPPEQGYPQLPFIDWG
ncbi:unnamed protein product [Microthlaspi erraticum]|uniref:C3H1-type domain-containing protein n=1 Tax=Microthlaspi erraticum TaxID=1685480 RepID=A0A6D2HLT1_9BRAS|nr:unnamed protein product [Microthlaspi erraticum]